MENHNKNGYQNQKYEFLNVLNTKNKNAKFINTLLIFIFQENVPFINLFFISN